MSIKRKYKGEKMKKSYLKKIYKFDEEKQAYIIDVSLDYYQELFNDWDASPIRKKDLEPELIEYLEASSYDIPRRNKLEIRFTVPLSKENQEKEKKALSAIHNNFLTSLYFTKKELGYSMRKILLYVILGFSFIGIAYVVKNQLNINIGFDLLNEGLFIGGWVLLWEAFSLFFFSMHDLRKKKSMYTRFLESKISFIYLKNK